jgi:hypothetical protein
MSARTKSKARVAKRTAEKTVTADMRRSKPRTKKEKPVLDGFSNISSRTWHDDGWVSSYADRGMTVIVTPEMAKFAKPDNAGRCAMAFGLKHAFGETISVVQVGSQSTRLADDTTKTSCVFHNSSELNTAIRDFKKHKKWRFPTAAFRLMPYPQSLRRGYKRPGTGVVAITTRGIAKSARKTVKSVKRKNTPVRTIVNLHKLRAISKTLRVFTR